MRRPHAYVVGPYTDDTIPQEKANEREAQNEALMLARIGFVPFVPHVALGLLTPRQMKFQEKIEVTEDEIMMVLYKHLYICDCVYLMHGWQNSKGSRKEVRLAKRWDKPLIEGLEQAEDFWNSYTQSDV